MKHLLNFSIMLTILIGITLPSCMEEEDILSKGCKTNDDCPYGEICNTETGQCIDGGSGENGAGESEFPEDSENSGNETDKGDDDTETTDEDDDSSSYTGDGDCAPGDIKECEYSGPPETKDVGVCKAAKAICQNNETWGPCEGEVLPSTELCNSGRDENCDGTVDNCEYEEPEDFELENCDDSSLDPNSKDPVDFALSMELCPRYSDEAEYGIKNADFLFPDETCCPRGTAYGIISNLGSNIQPQKGSYMLALSSGKVKVPFEDTGGFLGGEGESSNPPPDWYAANGNAFPSSPACGSSGDSGGKANDPVMLKMVIKAPPTAKGFEFNINFLTFEYPSYVCTKFNDFFVSLLDSEYTSDDPEMQNPEDKNLARDKDGNQVGVNLAPSGLFKICPDGDYDGCEGTTALQGSGLEGHGGTGWLLTRGNIVPEEEITIRFAIWDAGDHVLDSIVLIDNFNWLTEETKPGTGDM